MLRIDLLNHQFSRSLRGYNPEEVEAFLQDIADTMAKMSDEKVKLTNKIAKLEKQVKIFAQREASMRETLVASQKMADNIKSQAQKEAMLIIEAAQTKSENLTTQANIRLAKILEEISEARRLKAQFEFKVRSVIESHLKLLELGQLEDERLEELSAQLETPWKPKKGLDVEK